MLPPGPITAWEIVVVRKKLAMIKAALEDLVIVVGILKMEVVLLAALMAGKYFAQFFESAGEAFDENKKPTNDENLIKFKEYWGEGSNKAKNLARYGHVSTKTSLEEGVYGLIPYRGRLKPCVENDFKAIRATLSNAGCMNLSRKHRPD